MFVFNDNDRIEIYDESHSENEDRYAVYERTIKNRRRVMQRRSPFIMNKVLILVIDGCAPEFITPEFAPNIHRLAKPHPRFPVRTGSAVAGYPPGCACGGVSVQQGYCGGVV